MEQILNQTNVLRAWLTTRKGGGDVTGYYVEVLCYKEGDRFDSREVIPSSFDVVPPRPRVHSACKGHDC
jgi:hypothetical protein